MAKFSTETHRGFTVTAFRSGLHGGYAARGSKDGSDVAFQSDRFEGLGAKMRAMSQVRDMIDRHLCPQKQVVGNGDYSSGW